MLYINILGQSVCDGDSGGGLVFKRSDDRYYIRGVVSNGPQKKDWTCDNFQIALYTDVKKHKEFVQIADQIFKESS